MISKVLRVEMSAFYTVLILISFLLMSFSSETPKPQSQLQRLPNKDSDFKEIITNDFVYIDKTPYLIDVLNTGVILCIVTRPRGFGKTLFVDMMDHFFSGKHSNFFKNLSVYESGNSMLYRKEMRIRDSNITAVPSWVKYPVIRFDFNSINDFDTREQFEIEYEKLLLNMFNRYQIQCKKKNVSFLTLVSLLLQKFNGAPIIVLVDEYDFPYQYALERLKNKTLAEDIKRFMLQFLNQIKSCTRMLGFVFVTGVTKIPPCEMQSGPNNFIDFTHRPELAQAFGLSKSEIQTSLREHVKEFGKMIGMNDGSAWDAIFGRLVDRYDGYRFVLKGNEKSKETVLNPISTIDCLKTGKLSSLWSATGSMNRVLKSFYNEFELYKKHIFDENYRISSKELVDRFNPIKGTIPLPVWMFLYGYLTIADYHELDNGTFVDLKYPNHEIRTEILDQLVNYIPFNDTTFNHDQLENQRLLAAFQTSNLVKIIQILRKFGFQPFVHPFNDSVSKVEITKRLQTIFTFAQLQPIHDEKFKKDQNSNEDAGDIDFLIGVNGTAYVISTKCHGTDSNERAYAAMKQLVEYANNHPQNFWKCVHEKSCVPVTSPVIFLALGFGYDNTGRLTDWASMTYANKFPLEKSIEVDNTTLGSNLREKIKKLLSPVH